MWGRLLRRTFKKGIDPVPTERYIKVWQAELDDGDETMEGLAKGVVISIG